MLPGLAFLRERRFELAFASRNHKKSDVGLRGARNHVFDKISVSWCIDDSEVVLGALELPQSDVDGDAALTFSLKFVEDPGLFEGAFAHLSRFLFELLNGSLVDSAALLDQMSGSSGFSRVDVTDNYQIYMKLISV